MRGSVSSAARVLLVLAAGMLGWSCDSSSNASRVHFSINGDSNCSDIQVYIELDEADAVLARRGGSVDCVLDAILEAGGCDASFVENDDGTELAVTIDNCSVPAVSTLFQCGFTQGELSDVGLWTISQCTCPLGTCDLTPPVCVSSTPSPSSCENCDNGIDDNFDEEIDCDDFHCQHSVSCAATTTSVTVQSTAPTSSTTSTTSPASE